IVAALPGPDGGLHQTCRDDAELLPVVSPGGSGAGGEPHQPRRNQRIFRAGVDRRFLGSWLPAFRSAAGQLPAVPRLLHGELLLRPELHQTPRKATARGSGRRVAALREDLRAPVVLGRPALDSVPDETADRGERDSAPR